MARLTPDDLHMRFGAGRPNTLDLPSRAPVHRDFRHIFKTFAAEVDAWLPEGRYKDLALLELEKASMWSHKSIQNDL